jgi:ketosteroid isomerase-like protein
VSEENVAVAKRAVDAYNRRDLTTYEEIWTSDFELFPAVPGAFGGGSYEGREGLELFFQALDDTWEELQLVAKEFRDLGDRVLVLVQVEARGRGSGAPVAGPQSAILDFRDGKISRVRSYLDHAEALHVAGLEE